MIRYVLLDFFTQPIPDIVPSSMQSEIERLKNAASKKESLELAHKILTTRYYGSSLLTYVAFWRLFWSVEQSWPHTGFLQCTGQNNILRTLLVKSGHFNELEIGSIWTWCWIISPHQYLQVKVDDEWVAVDPWAYHAKKKGIGEHAGL